MLAHHNPHLSSEKQTKYLLKIIDEATCSDYLDIIKNQIKALLKIALLVTTHDNYNSFKRLYRALAATIELINDLIAFAKHQQLFTVKFETRIEKKIEFFSDLTHCYQSFEKRYSSEEASFPQHKYAYTHEDLSHFLNQVKACDKANDKIVQIRNDIISNFCTEGNYLSTLSAQLNALSKGEVAKHIKNITLEGIKRIKSEEELLKYTENFYKWLIEHDFVLSSLNIMLRIFEQVRNTMLQLTKLNKNHDMVKQADLIISLMPLNNAHVKNIENIFFLQKNIKKRYSTLRLASLNYVPLATSESTVTELTAPPTRRSHVRRQAMADNRGFSTIWSPREFEKSDHKKAEQLETIPLIPSFKRSSHED